MAEARADCAAESERLHVATTAYNALLNGKAASMANTDVKSVKDTKTLDVLSKAVKASTPKAVSCKADSRDAVVTDTKAITANTAWYWTHGKSLNRLVNAVETSKLDRTVDDADALYKETDGEVADGKTRASLLDAVRTRDAEAIAKAVKRSTNRRPRRRRPTRRRRPRPNRKPPRLRPPRSSRRRHRNPKHIQAADRTRTAATRIRAPRPRPVPAVPHPHRRNPMAAARRPVPAPTCTSSSAAAAHPPRTGLATASPTSDDLHGFSAGRPNVQTGMPAIGFQWSRMGRNRIPVRDH